MRLNILACILDKVYKFQVSEDFHKSRIDKFLSSQESDLTRSQIQYLILKGKVNVNDVVVLDCARKVRTNDVIEIETVSKPSNLKPCHDKELDIVHEDDDILVINKPKNLSVHPNTVDENDTLANILVSKYQNLPTLSGVTRPGILHRLDKDTTGLMIVTKNEKALVELSGQMMQKKITKKYYALVYGFITPVIGTIVTKIAPSRQNHTKMQVIDGEGGQIAITHYKVLKSYENRAFSLVECELETGRTHQIRVHLRYKNNPIVGDRKYSNYYNLNPNVVTSHALTAIKEINRQALHSYYIKFQHPISKEYLEFSVPIASDIQNIISLLASDAF